MEGIGNQSLRIEHVSSCALADGHEQIDVQAESSDTDAGILSVGGSKVGIVMMVMMSMRVSSMQTVVRERGHCGQRFSKPRINVDRMGVGQLFYVRVRRSQSVAIQWQGLVVE